LYKANTFFKNGKIDMLRYTSLLPALSIIEPFAGIPVPSKECSFSAGEALLNRKTNTRPETYQYIQRILEVVTACP
jgi:hypothetical protein